VQKVKKDDDKLVKNEKQSIIGEIHMYAELCSTKKKLGATHEFPVWPTLPNGPQGTMTTQDFGKTMGDRGPKISALQLFIFVQRGVKVFIVPAILMVDTSSKLALKASREIFTCR
jgi:hypothetical protein